MTTFIRRAAIAAFAFVGSVSLAFAQPTVPGAGNVGTPPLSPYLNLLRNNNNNANPAFNYLTITRPQMQFNQAANQLNQQLQATNFQLQQQAGQNNSMVLGGDSNLPLTGHTTSFGYLGNHFNNLSGVAGGRSGGTQFGGGMNRPLGGGAGAAGLGASAARGAGAAGIRR